MPALASLDDLKSTRKEIERLNAKYPEACREIITFLKKHRKIGYKNVCKMFTGEATPEKLKGVGPSGLIGSHPVPGQF